MIRWFFILKKIVTMTDARFICSLIRCCNYINDISKVYKDWIRADRNVVGFWAHTNSNLGKEKKLERIAEWCKERNLPVTILNDESHLTRFKIKINYEK